MPAQRWHWKSEARSHRAVTRWLTRCMPFVLGGLVGFGSWVVTKSICIDFLIGNGDTGIAITFLTLYWLFVVLLVVSYLRTIFTVFYNPGLVPLGPRFIRQQQEGGSSRNTAGSQEEDLESRPYSVEDDKDPDSPGLEKFYTKDVFACQSDGRPMWCAYCKAWKPDRAHHSREIQRCVLKMDHYCPWAGGMISATSFKFFVQFVFYASLYATITLAAAAYTISRLLRDGQDIWPQLIATTALAALFALFTGSMSMASANYIYRNLTNVDSLSAGDVVHQLAIRVPRGTPWTVNYETITYPLARAPSAEVGEPLQQSQTITTATTIKPVADQEQVHTTNPPLSEKEQRRAERDNLATRTFAIVRSEKGENPWDLGGVRNWYSIMGNNPIDWVLPIRQSPGVLHDSQDSLYPMGPVIDRIRQRHNLPTVAEGPNGIEMAVRPQRAT